MADAATKYAHDSAHTRRTPSLLMEYSELSHSLSGSHLNDRQAPSSRAARARLNTAPNDDMTSDVVLLELKNMSVLWSKAEGRDKRYRSSYLSVSCPRRVAQRGAG